MKYAIGMMLACTLLFSCSLEHKIAKKLPEQSNVKPKTASLAINRYIKKKHFKGPYVLSSIAYRNDTTCFLLRKKDWEHRILMDRRGRIVGSYVRLDEY